MTAVRTAFMLLVLVHALPARAADLAKPAQQEAVDPLLFAGEGWTLKLGLDAAIQGTSEFNSWWNLTDAFPPPNPHDPDMSWTEAYVKPSAKLEIAAGPDATLYGGLAAVASYNWGWMSSMPAIPAL